MRLERPWKPCRNETTFWVESANGIRFAHTYIRDDKRSLTSNTYVSEETARRVTANIAKLGALDE